MVEPRYWPIVPVVATSCSTAVMEVVVWCCMEVLFSITITGWPEERTSKQIETLVEFMLLMVW